MKKYDYIDAIRGIAIFGVLIIHSLQFGSNEYIPNNFQNILKEGARGVQLFFIMSAFTLFLSLYKRSESGKFQYVNFFIRRIFRIVPLYYTALIYFSIFQVDRSDPNFQGSLISNILFIHGFHPEWTNGIIEGGWSIGVEMPFYLIIPLLFKYIKNINHALFWLIFTLILSILFFNILDYFQNQLQYEQLETFKYFSFFSQLPVFSLGILLFFISDLGKHIREDHHYNSLNKKVVIIFAVFLFFCMSVYSFKIQSHIYLSGVLLLFCFALESAQSKIFVNKFFIFLGKISYSLYLSHFAVRHLMNKFGVSDFFKDSSFLYSSLNFSIRLAVLLVISTIISYLLYILIEMPSQKLGKKIITYIASKQFKLAYSRVKAIILL